MKRLMTMTTISVGLSVLLFFDSCTERIDHKGKTPLAEVDGNFLYMEDLFAVFPTGLTDDDSVGFANDFIRRWVEDILLYEKAQDNIPDNKWIEKQVEDYRKTLIMQSYQQALIYQKLVEEVSEQELETYYNQNRELFTVESPIIKGLFIKVPLTAPRIADVRQWYKAENNDAVEKLEKYSLRNAVKYEYFYDKWVYVSDILDLIPLKHSDAETYLQRNRNIELKDSAFYYFLNISDYRAAGDAEPYEVARAHARKLLLNVKQVQFMKDVRTDLYEQAEKKNRIKYYNIN